jgi:hypothetical protein
VEELDEEARVLEPKSANAEAAEGATTEFDLQWIKKCPSISLYY